MDSNNDITKLNKLGWTPKYSIQDGLNKVIDFNKNILVPNTNNKK